MFHCVNCWAANITCRKEKKMERKKLALRLLLRPLVVPFFILSIGATASADDVEERIKQLEQIQRTNSEELDRLRAQHMEMRREATAAAAALPTFTYRPGNGLTIAAADRSWSMRFFHEFHLHVYNHINGEAEPGGKGFAGRDPADKFTTGDLFLRRNRTYIHFCWEDCFYLVRWGLDADTGEVLGTQTADFYVNFSKMNPYLPDFFLANPGGQSARYVSRSSETSAQVEIAQDMMADGSAHNLSHRGLGLQWVNAPLGPGDFLLALEATRPFFSSAGNDAVLGGGASSVPSGSNENADNADRWTAFLKAGTRPFLKTKNKWLEKTKLGFGYQVNSPSLNWSSTTRRIRLRTMDRVGRVDVIDIRGIGKGLHHRFEWGFEWGVGPYLFRNENGLSAFRDKAGVGSTDHKGVHGHFWSLGNELFLWSPKGFLTGSGTTAHSVQLGWRFERSEASCGVAGCANNFDLVKRAHLTLRELDLWYYIRPSLSVGVWWNWWRSSNTDTDVQHAVGCDKTPTDEGKSCDWHSVNTGLRFNF
jgi:hypothetical protein